MALRPSEKTLRAFAFISGACMLLYQGLWLRIFGLIFGSTTRASSVVLAAFMGGLALGSWLAKKRSWPRIFFSYAAFEALTGSLALLSWALLKIPGISAWLACLSILLPCVAAGATLPLLSEGLLRQGREFRAGFASLYRFNTLGALAGVFACLLLLPKLGINAMFLLAASANFLLAFASFRIPEAEASATPKSKAPTAPALWLVAAACGIFSFAIELLWMRSLAPVLGSSVYALNLVIAAVLFGFILGALAYQRLAPKLSNARQALALSLLALGLWTLLSLPLAGLLPAAYLKLCAPMPISLASHQGAGLLLSLAFLLPSTFLQGLCFPLLTHLRPAGTAAATEAAGELYLFNTLGALLGALAAGFWMLPELGLQACYPWLALLPLLSAISLGAKTWGFEGPRRGVLLAAAMIACVSLALRFRPWDPLAMSSGPYLAALRGEKDIINAGSSISFSQDGREALVAVRDTEGSRVLSINGKPDASNRWDAVSQKLVAHLPLLMHKDPSTALVIGWGSGSSAGSASLHGLKKIDCVEIEPAAYAAAGFFEDINFGVAKDPRFKIYFGDGRNFLLASPLSYDVIISQPTNPWISGVANLFTSEFYASVSSHLAQGGIFGQWFQYYNMGSADMKTLLRTFSGAFPYSSLWVLSDLPGSLNITGDLMLLGSREPMPLDAARLEARLHNAALAKDLERAGVSGIYGLLAHYWLQGPEIAELAGEGPAFGDMRPSLEFSAVHSLYTPEAVKRETMLENFALLKSKIPGLLPPATNWKPLSDKAQPREQAAAWTALADGYLQAHLFERAAALLEKSLSLDPSSAKTWGVKAKLEALNPDRSVSRGLAMKALALDPSCLDALVVLGGLDYEEGNWEGSLGSYRRILHDHPQDPRGHYGAGVCLARLQRWNESIAELKLCLNLDPNQEQARRLMAEIKSKFPQLGL